MKRTITIKILVLASFLVFNISTLQVKANQNIINIPMDYPTLSEALASGNIHPGDTVHVWSGIYVENPVINVSDIKIIGQPGYGAVINPLLPGPCITIVASGVSIMMLTIQDTNAFANDVGITIKARQTSIGQCKIYRNRILDFSFGVKIDNSSNNEIIGNDISGCTNHQASAAIWITNTKATCNRISGNEIGRISPCSYGIAIQSASGNTIVFNNFWNTQMSPAAWISPGSINAWDDQTIQKGNWWGNGAPTPYIIDHSNIDHYCHPSFFNWSTYPWDVNRDCRGDMQDISPIAKAFGTEWPMEKWNPICDITGMEGFPDNQVNMMDISLAAKNFGWKYP